jgi:hypothetical protein
MKFVQSKGAIQYGCVLRRFPGRNTISGADFDLKDNDLIIRV